ELRELTGHEEELFEDRRLASNSAALCNELLARCLVAPGREPGQARARIASLTVAERDLALVALRRLSLGDRVETHVDCPGCAEVNEVEFDLGLLPTTLPGIPERISGTLGDGTDVVLRLPTAGDQAELLAAGIDGAARRRSWLLARVLLEYADAVAPFDVDAVHELATARRRELEALLDAALPDFELGMEVCCPACAREFTAPFSIDSFFLLS
ncbi:MAG TPA: hypothetical protein VM869_03465, partial [Enhygromyxa sp.]|nr:hypothetical protein [Enhygromyxa sp.]